MSVFHANFAASTGPMLLSQHGESVTLDLGVGTPRAVQAIVKRDIPDGIDESGRPVFVTIVELLSDAELGALATEIVVGRAKVSYPVRVGGASEYRSVRKPPRSGNGLVALEVS